MQTLGYAERVAPARRLSNLRAFLGYYRFHLPMVAADIGAAILIALTALGLPLTVNHVTSHLGEWQASSELVRHIVTAGLVMLGLVVVQSGAGMVVDYQGHWLGARLETRVRQELFDHCQSLSFGFYDRNRTGQLMSRITTDTFWLGELFHHGPEDLLIIALKLVGASAILIYLDWPLGLLVTATLPFAIAYTLYCNGLIHRALSKSKRQAGELNERLEDTLGGIRVVQSYTAEAMERDSFARENDRFLQSRRDGYWADMLFYTGSEGFAQFVTIAVVSLGAWRIAIGALTLSDMLTFLLCVGVLVDPIKRMANVTRVIQEGWTGFVRAQEILAVRPEIVERPDATALDVQRGAIAFRDVGFVYGAGHAPVFNRLNLTIAPGEFVALVGASGVGKSTLAALLPRFYDVTAGAIEIDGRDIRDVTLPSLRRAVGIVQQDVYLFAGTVAENLRYGRPGATDAEVVAAARAANAHDFIMRLPDRYETDIGQRGVKLSGGQKQRLTIARAFLKDPPILIFDEATSALDNESEEAVQTAVLDLASGRTTLVIAHRLSTVRRADRIVVLTADGIAEEGRHDDLLQAGGPYAALYAAQARI
ncbi:ABC transporter ATP-binding protein [Rhizobium halophytocola]|nr:ABC transporter ATP-binding protein [Rhizobium halophytocola]